eukprot:782297-Prymnesium_polylepis.1
MCGCRGYPCIRPSWPGPVVRRRSPPWRAAHAAAHDGGSPEALSSAKVERHRASSVVLTAQKPATRTWLVPIDERRFVIVAAPRNTLA